MQEMSQQDLQQQLAIFDDAQLIYIKRSKERGQMWKEMGIDDAVHHLKSKAERVFVLHHNDMDAEDDALDLINYAAFFLRHKRGEV